MTNEEIVIEIQRGRSDLYGQLWEQVRAFIAYCAVIRYRDVQDKSGVDLDDLIQSGYLGLVSAVKHFDPERGSFLTCLAFYLKRSFNNACGVGWERMEKDPIHAAASLDAPLNENDPDGVTFGATIPAAVDMAEGVEERVYMEQLHKAIEKLLSRLPSSAADIIRSTYFNGEPAEHIAARYGTTAKRIFSRRDTYLNQLRVKARSTPEGKELRRFLDDNTNYYLQIGPDSFNRTHTSAPEYLAMMREDLENIYRGKTK